MTFHDLDLFARGFVGMAFDDARAAGAAPASDTFFDPETTDDREEGRSDGTIPSDSDLDELPADEIEKAAAFCAALQAALGADLVAACERDGYDLERAGGDAYLTVCGHGTGFWDRDELEEDGLGDRLSKAAGYGEVSIYPDGNADGWTLRFDCLYSDSVK